MWSFKDELVLIFFLRDYGLEIDMKRLICKLGVRRVIRFFVFFFNGGLIGK